MTNKMNKKVCPRCLKKKSLDKFKTRPNGNPESYCYPCQIDYYREYNTARYASPESRRAELDRTKRRYHELFKPQRMERKKRLIIEMGGQCVRCGYNKSAAALDFDHVDPKTKQPTISHLLAVHQPWAWEMARVEARKCRLICSNCHREITYPGHELN
jgi:hypothetical protein